MMMAMLILMMAAMRTVWSKQAGDVHILALGHQFVVELRAVETDSLNLVGNNFAMMAIKIRAMVAMAVEYSLVGDALQYPIEGASAIINAEME